MRKAYFFSAFTSMIIFSSNCLYAQTTKVMTTECGKAIEGEFTAKHEAQDIKIRMGAGDMLEVNVVPVGKYLKVRIEIYDPSGSQIYKDDVGMFRNEKKNLVIKTDVLSASGFYTTRIYDHYFGYETNVGSYTLYATCYKKNGDVIEPK